MKVRHHFDDDEEFESLLSDAEINASSEWEMEFVADMRDRYEEYGTGMYLSDRQLEILERLANDE